MPKRNPPTLTELEHIANELNTSYPSLLYQWYVIDAKSLHYISSSLDITVRRVRKHLLRFGIPIRPRGGKRHKVTITPTLIAEVLRNGVELTSVRLGISYDRLNKLMHEAENTAAYKALVKEV